MLKEARALVDRAIARIPQLTTFGVGIHYRHHKEGAEVAAWLLAQQQADLFSESSLRSVACCAEWIKARTVSRTFKPNRTSYAYKHMVEEARWAAGDPNPYTSNGAFIAAAAGMGMGFKVVGPNVVFDFTAYRDQLAPCPSPRFMDRGAC